jgi:HlyD family secretion protein
MSFSVAGRLSHLWLVLTAVSLGACDLEPVAPASDAPLRIQPIAVAKGRIDVEGGTVRLAAQREGLIREVFVEEGDRVKKGQVLATLEATAAELAVQTAEAELSLARAQLPALEVRVDAAKRKAERLRPLAASGAASRIDLEDADDAVRIANAELGVAKQAVRGAESRLAVQRYEVEARTIRSPMDGRIVRRSAKPGDGTSTFNVTELFLLAPDTPRIVRAELDEQFVGAVRPGQTVKITLEYDLEQRFVGTVVRVGEVFGLSRNRSEDPLAPQDTRVVELVTSIQDGEKLRIGQRVLAEVQP